jgi:hypothetical protein
MGWASIGDNLRGFSRKKGSDDLDIEQYAPLFTEECLSKCIALMVEGSYLLKYLARFQMGFDIRAGTPDRAVLFVRIQG